MVFTMLLVISMSVMTVLIDCTVRYCMRWRMGKAQNDVSRLAHTSERADKSLTALILTISPLFLLLMCFLDPFQVVVAHVVGLSWCGMYLSLLNVFFLSILIYIRYCRFHLEVFNRVEWIENTPLNTETLYSFGHCSRYTFDCL